MQTETPTQSTPDTPIISDSSDATFMADVVETSKHTPVLVDFWAPWCGPCKQLMPVLERLVNSEGGAVKLVKINIDENPGIAGQMQVRSVPAVYAFKDGKPVDGFMGAQPESELKKFIGRLTGDSNGAQEAEDLVERAKDALTKGDTGGAAQDFAQAISLDPENPFALAGLARLYLDSGDAEHASVLLQNAPESLNEHPDIKSLRTALSLSANAPSPTQEDTELPTLLAAVESAPNDHGARLDLAQALAARSDNAGAIDHLLHSINIDRGFNDEAARLFLLTIFEAEGVESDLAISGRRRLSSILFA